MPVAISILLEFGLPVGMAVTDAAIQKKNLDQV